MASEQVVQPERFPADLQSQIASQQALWLKIATGLLAILLAILAFFGRDMYSDVKAHTIQLTSLTQQMTDVRGQIADVREDLKRLNDRTDENGKSLARIEGLLSARDNGKSSSADSEPRRR